MRANSLFIKGNFRCNDTVDFEVIETIITGEGTCDFKMNTIHRGRTTEKLPDNDKKFVYDFFYERYAKEGFEFECNIS